MALIEWTAALETGIKVIDEEHKELVSMINDLHSAGASKAGAEETRRIVYELDRYVKTHFVVEEEIMRTAGYDKYLDHKALHDEFRARVSRLKQDAEAGELEMMGAITQFLKRWFTQHILYVDRDYIETVLGKKK